MTENTADNIPASVRNAPDLSALAANQAENLQGAPASLSGVPAEENAQTQAGEPTWRFEVESTEDFQKFVQMSSQGAVIFALYAGHSPASLETVDHLEKFINSAGGNMLLASVDITKLPEIGQAFQIQGVPAAIAVLAGQPAPMFNSQVTPEQMRDVLGQVLQIAAQQQLPGGFAPNNAGSEPEEKPLPPLHQEAVDAIDRGDYEAARAAYTKALNENPGDTDAKIGLAQVGLLDRVKDLNLDDARSAAAANPTDVQAALNIADLDITGGHVEDAFNRLIRIFPQVDADSQNTIRERLLELFEVVGVADPRVKKARSALMMALF